LAGSELFLSTIRREPASPPQYRENLDLALSSADERMLVLQVIQVKIRAANNRLDAWERSRFRQARKPQCPDRLHRALVPVDAGQ
jgi:hypothetical protein